MDVAPTPDVEHRPAGHQAPVRRRRLRRRALLLVGAVAVTSASVVPAASAGSLPNTHMKVTKVMVKVVTVTGFGSILETKKGLPLYVDTAPPCTTVCLYLWPPLLMPANKTIPLGHTGLGTTPFGSSLQVTFNGQPLYTFLSDVKKKPPTGNNFQFFTVVPG